MTTIGVPSGFSSSAALTLLRTLQTVSSDDERFLAVGMSSISAHVQARLPAGALFAILGAVAASRGQMVSVVEGDAARDVAQQDGRTGVSDDLLMQFGATATAVLRTEGAQIPGGSQPDGQAGQVSVTVASLRFADGQRVGTDSTAAYIYRYAQNYVRDNAMSSEDISDTLYGGGSIGSAAIAGDRSFADVIRGLYGMAEGQSAMASGVAAWLAEGRPPDSMIHFDGQTDDQVVDAIADLNRGVQRLDEEASALTAAFGRHALTFQKASEVRGLDYAETIRAQAFAGRGGVDSSSTMNADFLARDADGRRHAMLRVGDVELYASW